MVEHHTPNKHNVFIFYHLFTSSHCQYKELQGEKICSCECIKSKRILTLKTKPVYLSLKCGIVQVVALL